MSTAVAEACDVPSHVPAGRVRDFDHRAIAAIDGDLHRGWKAAVEGLPEIFYTPRNGGHWVLTRFDDIEAAYRDTARFSNAGLVIPPVPRDRVKAFKFGPAEYDPPEQGKFRKLVAPFFNADRLQDLGAKAQALATSLIDAIAPRGECDFVTDVARRYPIGVFLSLVGLPQEDADIVLPWADLVIRHSDEESRVRGIAGMLDYLGGRLDERRAVPRDDLISRIVHGRIDDRPATPEEALGACGNVMFAGLDTVVAASGFFMRFLATSPEHRRQLIDRPEIIPQAVDELLRYHGLINLGRLVTEDIDFAGVAFRAGDRVLVPTTLCGLDERRFPDPMRIDFDRGDRKIMTFGTGPHLCLGAPLARIELRILLETWLARIPDFAVTDMAEVQLHSGGVNSITRLPLRWNVG